MENKIVMAQFKILLLVAGLIFFSISIHVSILEVDPNKSLVFLNTIFATTCILFIFSIVEDGYRYKHKIPSKPHIVAHETRLNVVPIRAVQIAEIQDREHAERIAVDHLLKEVRKYVKVESKHPVMRGDLPNFIFGKDIVEVRAVIKIEIKDK